jgi:regulatory protein
VTDSNGPGTDGHLATVSYLFGAPAPSESDDDMDPAAVADGAASAIRDSGPRDLAAPTAGGSNSASGWYLEPGTEDVTGPAPVGPAPVGDEPDDDKPDEHAAPEAESIVAARRFLAAVERQPAASRQSPAVPRISIEAAAEADESPEPRKSPAVRKASINALARKGMSSAEMTSLLESREIEPEEVAAEVERLEAAGLLDDRVLAETLVRTLRERKGLGRSGINSELRRRKVDQAAIDEALESVDVDDELERATEVAVKRAGQLSSYDRQTAERRLSAFLMRRGYSGSVVGAAVAAALGPVGPRFR